ncbi:Alpha/Beta hydrolase protein [Phycomyces nitens]|nr:Alpha/Beta hydrolase protein [Phycomyces nitens]
MGRSSRPKWGFSRKSNETWDDIVERVEDHFVETLEEWREKVGLEKMTLMGHSLGGYLSTCYALKYPQRVEKLILVSPVGIPDTIIDNENPKKTPNEQLEDEANQLNSSLQAQAVDVNINPDDSNTDPQSNKTPARKVPGWITYIWNRNITPMSIVRFGGPFGPTLVNSYTSRRFAHLETEEKHNLYDYL